MDKNEKRVAVLNPYDVLGKAHNKGLDYVVERLSSQSPEEIKPEKCVDLISHFLESLKDEHSHADRHNRCDHVNESIINNYIAVGNVVNMLALYPVNELVERSKVKDNQKCFIDAILNVSDDLDLDYDGSLKVLMNIEDRILASDLSKEDLELPLSMVSIAKYSVKYWMEQLASDNSRWKDYLGDDVSKFKFPWKADAIGAMTGIGGGVIGSLGGAIGGSVAAALGWK